MSSDALDVVLSAYRNGDMDKMLLEERPYRYMHRYSPSPTNDINGLRQAIYKYLPQDQKDNVQSAYRETLARLASEKAGIMPVAYALMYEVGTARDGDTTLGLDVENLARLVSATIASNEAALELIPTDHARDWPYGSFGDLRRVNRIILEDGGPNILPT